MKNKKKKPEHFVDCYKKRPKWVRKKKKRYPLTGRLAIMKISVLSKLIYRLNRVPMPNTP